VKLHLGKRARSHIEREEAWWAENRPAAPDLFAREFKEILEHIRSTPGAGVRWPTATRPSLRRILMPRTLNHIYFRVDDAKGVIRVLAVWGAPRERGPKL
jgi:plasmid stabilization system protein ParE